MSSLLPLLFSLAVCTPAIHAQRKGLRQGASDGAGLSP
jgi:hypothetical protein